MCRPACCPNPLYCVQYLSYDSPTESADPLPVDSSMAGRRRLARSRDLLQVRAWVGCWAVGATLLPDLGWAIG